MNRYLYLFLFVSLSLWADDDYRLAPEAESLALSHGCVNVVTGEFTQQTADLIIDGPSPLVHSRIYDSGLSNAQSSIGCGFTRGIPQFLQWLSNDKKAGCCYANLEEREGATLHYCGRYTRAGVGTYKVSDFILNKGYTNYSPYGLSGTSNLHNVILRHQGHGKHFVGGSWEITLGCGTKRLYNRRPGTKYGFDLSEEIRPDGNRVRYHYDDKYRPVHIYLADPKNGTPLIEYKIKYEKNRVCTTGNNGQTLCYALDRNQCVAKKDKKIKTTYKTIRLTVADGDHLVSTRYDYASKVSVDEMVGHVTKVSQPDGRAVYIDYYQPSSKVKSLSGPVGRDGKIHPFAMFEYPNRGECKVSGPCGELTRYLYSPHDCRISRKERWHQGKLYNQQKYFWGKGEQLGNLISKALCDSSGKCLSATYFIYDNRHNVSQEILSGNITGLSSPTFTLGEHGNPLGHVESYAIQRTYDPNYNVILTEIGSDGLLTEYRYQPGTNLLKEKRIGGNTPSSLEFFSYDAYGNLIQHIIDNGTAVRTMTEWEPITTPLDPAFGKPKKRKEKYWEAGKEYVLRVTEIHYNEYGHPIQEEIYDAKGNHCYSIHRLYDPAGRLLEEIDPIKQKTIHHYDANGNKILTHWEHRGITTEYHYDLSNRLIKETEIHPHASYVTTHRYDHSSRKIATVDFFGNETRYGYNDLGQLISITHPSINGKQGVERFTYNEAGNKTVSIDVLGHVTRTSYTIRNQPICITYPDGSQERYQYNSNGSLAKHTTQTGLSTIIYYDAYMRPTRKTFHDAQGNYLYDTLATFNGSYIASETDANGIQTHYRYDGAGRLIETIKDQLRTELAYDSLGRQHKTIEWADEKTARVTIRQYDWLDRIIEERAEDQAGTLFSQHHYAYDSHGNRCLEETQTSQGLATKRIEYDTRSRPIRITDPLGQVTLISYDEEFKTGITTTTITDPLGNQTITVQNSLGHVTEELRKDAQGNTCARSQFFYDLAGRKIGQRDTAIAPGFKDRIVKTHWIYDKRDRIISLTEAAGSPEQKQTQYSYNSKGQKETVQLPDDTTLHHRYDALGRLQRYFASDQSFDYTYQYDLNGNVTEVIDSLNQTVTLREYDNHNRMICELLANGHPLRYTYDGLSRILSLSFPDGTGVQYTYDACHLKTVERLSHQSYRHHYTAYDFTGALLEEFSPIGRIDYTYDLLSRVREIRSVHFAETIPEDGYDAVGNLLQKTRQDNLRTISSRYTYDPLDQLASEVTSNFARQEYIYDSLANRRAQNKRIQRVNSLNQLTQGGGVTYTYDKRGNLIIEETPNRRIEYQYDALDRLTKLSRNGEEFHYQYDAFNRRLKKTGPDLEENYLYIDQNEVGMIDAQGKIRQLRILGLGKGAEIAAAVALELDEEIYIPIHDQSGHVAALVDLSSRTLAEGYAYTAFGQEQRYGSYLPNPWHFSSKRIDPESGWVFFGRRYYSPAIGRWTTPDPIGHADGPNLYAYLRNNPLTHFDLYGLIGAGINLGSEQILQQGLQQAMELQNQAKSNVMSTARDAGLADRRCMLRESNQLVLPRFKVSIPSAIGGLLNHFADFKPCTMSLPGKDHGFSVFYNPGINLNHQPIEKHMRAFSNVLGDSPVQAVFRGTINRFEDVVGIGLLRATADSQQVRIGTEIIRSLTAFEKSRGGRVLVIGYSGGADVTRYQLRQQNPEDVNKYVSVIGVAPSCILRKSECADTLNLISHRDHVTRFADPFTYKQAQRNPHAMGVKFLHSNFPFYQMDHDIMGPTYWPGLKFELERFYDKHARY